MSIDAKNFLVSKHQVLRLLGVTGALLLIPLIAMQITNEVSWKVGDFIVAAALLVSFGYSYELLSKLFPGKRSQLLIIVTVLLLLVLTWSILAVDLV